MDTSNNMHDAIYRLYQTGDYIRNNPTLDAEDSGWKFKRIVPALDQFRCDCCLQEVGLLDVGGGAGLLLRDAAAYLRTTVRVRKYALDLSGDMLQVQKANNPDLAAAIEGTIEETAFRDKDIDLALMVDVLEHLPDPVAALRELSRIARYVIFKVPMEDNLLYNVLNVLKGGGLRRDIYDKVGHVQFYTYKKLSELISQHTGQIAYSAFTNDFRYMLGKGYHRRLNRKERLVFTLGNMAFQVSPYLCSRLFPNSVIFFVKCS